MSGRLHHLRDYASQSSPALLFGLELFASDASERIKLRALSLIGELPLRFEPALLLHPVECGIERALFYAKGVLGELFELLGDAPSMEFAARKNAEDQHIESALDE